jgi:hypothetical protein
MNLLSVFFKILFLAIAMAFGYLVAWYYGVLIVGVGACMLIDDVEEYYGVLIVGVGACMLIDDVEEFDR